MTATSHTERLRVLMDKYRGWLGEFPDIALVLDNLQAEIDGNKSLDANFPPSVQGPWDIRGLRETLRRRCNKSDDLETPEKQA